MENSGAEELLLGCAAIAPEPLKLRGSLSQRCWVSLEHHFSRLPPTSILSPGVAPCAGAFSLPLASSLAVSRLPGAGLSVTLGYPTRHCLALQPRGHPSVVLRRDAGLPLSTNPLPSILDCRRGAKATWCGRRRRSGLRLMPVCLPHHHQAQDAQRALRFVLPTTRGDRVHPLDAPGGTRRTQRAMRASCPRRATSFVLDVRRPFHHSLLACRASRLMPDRHQLGWVMVRCDFCTRLL